MEGLDDSDAGGGEGRQGGSMVSPSGRNSWREGVWPLKEGDVVWEFHAIYPWGKYSSQGVELAGFLRIDEVGDGPIRPQSRQPQCYKVPRQRKNSRFKRG